MVPLTDTAAKDSSPTQ